MFIEKALGEIKGLKKIDVPIIGSSRPDEPTLRYKNQMILWCAPRKNLLWSAVKYHSDKKEIVKVLNEKQHDELLKWLVQRCAELDKEKPISKKAKGKTSKGKKSKSVIEKLEAKEKKAKSYSDSNGFSLKGIKITKEVEDWAKAKGYRLQCNSVRW